MDNENSKKKDIETIEVEWVVYSQNDRVVRKYFQVIPLFQFCYYNSFKYFESPLTFSITMCFLKTRMKSFYRNRAQWLSG